MYCTLRRHNSHWRRLEECEFLFARWKQPMQLCSWASRDGLRVGGLIFPPPRALFLDQQSRLRTEEREMHPQRKTHSPRSGIKGDPLRTHAIHSPSCSTTYCCTVQPAALSFLSPSSFPIRRRRGGDSGVQKQVPLLLSPQSRDGEEKG